VAEHCFLISSWVWCQRLGEAKLFAAGDERLSMTEMRTRLSCRSALVRPTSPVCIEPTWVTWCPYLVTQRWVP
jgi:hypothetical protein